MKLIPPTPLQAPNIVLGRCRGKFSGRYEFLPLSEEFYNKRGRL